MDQYIYYGHSNKNIVSHNMDFRYSLLSVYQFICTIYESFVQTIFLASELVIAWWGGWLG